MAGYKDKEWLKEAYYKDDRALSDIADEFGVTLEAVRYYMEKFDLPRRRRGAREGEDNPAWKGGPATLTCEVCGEDFEVPHYRGEQGTAKYCSWSCRNEGISDRYIGPGNSQYGVRGEDNDTHGRTGKSHPMYGVTGPDNPNWAGGGRWRDDIRWTRARSAALQRDGMECRGCGLTNSAHTKRYGHELHVHHIEHVSNGGAKFDVDNLKTLCYECHSNQHNGIHFPTLRNE